MEKLARRAVPPQQTPCFRRELLSPFLTSLLPWTIYLVDDGRSLALSNPVAHPPLSIILEQMTWL
jgi:hypothetical protein